MGEKEGEIVRVMLVHRYAYKEKNWFFLSKSVRKKKSGSLEKKTSAYLEIPSKERMC